MKAHIGVDRKLQPLFLELPTQNPPIGCQSVSDTLSLSNAVRKVEFKPLQLKYDSW